MQVWTNSVSPSDVADQHDYNITDNGNGKLTLSRSSDPNWSVPNEEIGYLLDDGDEITIKLDSMKVLKIDYMQQVEILSLLLANYNDRLEFKETKTIKSI